MPVPSNDVRLINSVCISTRSMMSGTPSVYTALVYEYVAHAAYPENSSETSDTDEDEDLNTWNALLELLTMPGSSPALQQSMQDGEVCRVACRATLAGQLVFFHGMVSRGAIAEMPKLSGASLHLHPCRRGKQGATATRPASLRVWYNTLWEYGLGMWQGTWQ